MEVTLFCCTEQDSEALHVYVTANNPIFLLDVSAEGLTSAESKCVFLSAAWDSGLRPNAS